MRDEHARRDRAAGGTALENCERPSEGLLDCFARDAAGTQQTRAVIEAGDDRRFDTNISRAAIEHEIDFVCEVVEHMLRADRTDMARAVRRWRSDRTADCSEQRVRDRMCRHAQTDGAETGPGGVANWR